MIIALLIIASLILIGIVFTIFLVNKSSVKLSTDCTTNFEKHAVALRNECQNLEQKIALCTSEINSNTENSKIILLSLLEKQLNYLKDTIVDGNSHLNNGLASTKNEMRADIESALLRLNEEIKNKYDQILKSQLEWQHSLTVDLIGKFNTIIEEIKNPLSID